MMTHWDLSPHSQPCAEAITYVSDHYHHHYHYLTSVPSEQEIWQIESSHTKRTLSTVPGHFTVSRRPDGDDVDDGDDGDDGDDVDDGDDGVPRVPAMSIAELSSSSVWSIS